MRRSLSLAALGFGRIRITPVRGGRLAGPEGAHLSGGVVETETTKFQAKAEQLIEAMQ